MRQAFAERLKQALKASDARIVSTVGLILAALNERDVAGVSEAEIRQMLQTMIKQRREAITPYDQVIAPTSRNENVTRSPSSTASCCDNPRRPRLNRRPRQSSPGQAHRASKTWARSWPRSAIAMQGLWSSPAAVRLSDGSWVEPEADCEEMSLTVSHLYVNSIRSYRRVARHEASSRGSLYPLGRQWAMAILGAQKHWLIDNYGSL
jgi:hypothetical protein